ncbi:MAG: hypothetical protein P4L03_02520 [Terracidiphilus sp.]|nr:hypothetical protein [Terracidiphilus sp.]
MKGCRVVAVLLVLAATLVQAEKKPKKPEAPEVLSTAEYVIVVSQDGDEFDAHTSPEDRLAINRVREALRSWGRYTYTADAAKADVVFVVRKGKTQDATRGHGRDQSGADRNVMDLGNNGDMTMRLPQAARNADDTQAEWTADMLWVCVRDANGKLSKPLWGRTFDGGLDGAHPQLMEQLRIAVEKEYPQRLKKAQQGSAPKN